MTKSLTEQMKTKNGAWYYVKTKEWGICHWLLFPDTLEFEKDIIEVLAPVPSYDEWQSYDKCADMLIDVNKKWLKTIVENKKLKKQLAIATKALEIYSAPTGIGETAYNALKEMEGVK